MSDADNDKNGVEPGDGICLGFIRVERSGDLDNVSCILCGHGAGPFPYFAIMNEDTGPVLYGPLCTLCAAMD